MARQENEPRDRVLSGDEIRRIWKATELPNAPFRYLARFLLLTAVRRSEAAKTLRV
jgi:integrase